MSERGLAVEYVDLRNLDAVRAATRPQTRAIRIESPTNPWHEPGGPGGGGRGGPRARHAYDLRQHVSLAVLSAPARTRCGYRGALHHEIDQRSFRRGGRRHRGTGCGLADRIGYLQNALGTCEAPFDCFLVKRGVKTLALRMEAHNRNALEIAQRLERHPKVGCVHHPGLESHPQRELAKRQMSGSGGTFSFRLRGGQAEVFRFLEAVRLFTLAESLGGVESLIEHPTTMTHRSIPTAIREAMGITPDLVRIPVGIEDVAGLIEDLEQALAEV